MKKKKKNFKLVNLTFYRIFSINSPSWNILRCIATFRLVIEDLTRWAAKFTWLNTVQADVELLAIVWVWEVWVSNNLTWLIILLLLLWTLESIGCLLALLDASFASCILRPHTCACVFVKVESTSALVLDIVAVNACVESVADCWIGMSEEAVLTWTVVILALCWLCCDRCKKLCHEFYNSKNSRPKLLT